MSDSNIEIIDDDNFEDIRISSSSSSIHDRSQNLTHSLPTKFKLSKYFCCFCERKNYQQSGLTTQLYSHQTKNYLINSFI